MTDHNEKMHIPDGAVEAAARAMLLDRFGSEAAAFFEPVPDDFPHAEQARQLFGKRVSEATSEATAALSAALPFFPSPSEEARPVAWPEEPDPAGEREQWGMAFAVQQFAQGLGVDNWSTGGGSESVEGDIWAAFEDIAKAGGFVTPNGDTMLSMGADALRVALSRPLEAAPVDGGEGVAWMHPKSGWVHHDRSYVAFHCEQGFSPLPLYAHPAPAVEGREGVAIKALEWLTPLGNTTLKKAETILGDYRTWTHAEANGCWFWQLATGLDRITTSGEGSDEATVRAAAEAHYRLNIRSALSVAPDKGLVEAVKPFVELADALEFVGAGNDAADQIELTGESLLPKLMALRAAYRAALVREGK